MEKISPNSFIGVGINSVCMAFEEGADHKAERVNPYVVVVETKMGVYCLTLVLARPSGRYEDFKEEESP